MNLHKSKIDWCTHTWNPVTGCLHGCDYCYARRFIARFQPHATERPMKDETGTTGIINEPDAPAGCYIASRPVKLCDETGEYVRSTPYPKGFAPTLNAFTLDYPKKRYIPSRVFVSSMGDLFGKWVPDSWIASVFSACKEAPQHTYLFLTKNPQRYQELAEVGKLPAEPNFWYGSTVTGPDNLFWRSDKHKTFVSIEPLLAPWEPVFDETNLAKTVDWLIIGAMTGPDSKERQPKREWVEAIVHDAGMVGTPVFMKDNLADVWGSELLREHPAGMVWPEEG